MLSHPTPLLSVCAVVLSVNVNVVEVGIPSMRMAAVCVCAVDFVWSSVALLREEMSKRNFPRKADRAQIVSSTQNRLNHATKCILSETAEILLQQLVQAMARLHEGRPTEIGNWKHLMGVGVSRLEQKAN